MAMPGICSICTNNYVLLPSLAGGASSGTGYEPGWHEEKINDKLTDLVVETAQIILNHRTFI